MSIILNHERLKRFFTSIETTAFQHDLQPMGAFFVKNGKEVIVLVDNEVSNKNFIKAMKALIKEHEKESLKSN